MSTQSPPPRLHMAVMIWFGVFPTIAAWERLLRDPLAGLPPVLRILILASLTVPLVVYLWLPLLLKLRARALARVQGGSG